jgi:hypothetical protein
LAIGYIHSGNLSDQKYGSCASDAGTSSWPPTTARPRLEPLASRTLDKAFGWSDTYRTGSNSCRG